MKVSFFLFLLFYFIKWSFASTVNNHDENSSESSAVIYDIIQVFPSHKITAMVYDKKIDETFERVIRRLNDVSIHVITDFEYFMPSSDDQLILVSLKKEKLMLFFEEMTRNLASQNLKVILICDGDLNEEIENVSAKYDLKNIFIISKKPRFLLEIKTFVKYSERRCSDRYDMPTSLFDNSTKNWNRNSFWHSINKLQNFHSCQLNFKIQGVKVAEEIALPMAQSLNFTTSFIDNYDPIDVACSSLYLVPSRFHHKCTQAIKGEKLFFLVPPGLAISHFEVNIDLLK